MTFGLSVECYVQYDGIYHLRIPDLIPIQLLLFIYLIFSAVLDAQVNTACETCFFALILSIPSDYKSGFSLCPSTNHEHELRGTPLCHQFVLRDES